MRAEVDTGTHREMGKTTEALFFTMRAEDIIWNGKRQARGCGAGLDGGGPSVRMVPLTGAIAKEAGVSDR